MNKDMTPYEQGGYAYSVGKSLDDNPYEDCSYEWGKWRNGWYWLGRGDVPREYNPPRGRNEYAS